MGPPAAEPDDAQRARIVASDGKARFVFAALAVVLPLVLVLLFRRQELRLRALVDHGQVATAVVTRVTRQNGDTTTHYRYAVGDRAYDWSVKQSDAPHPPGMPFEVTYLPEDPSLNRPGAAYPHAAFVAERKPGLQWGLPLGLFAFFGLCAFLADRNVRRLRGGAAIRTAPRVSPEAMGRVVAALMLVAMLGVNFASDVVAVQTAAFGARPLGLPVTMVVVATQLVLFLPFFWVFPHLMRIVVAARAFTKGGILLAVLRADGPLRRSRTIVVAGLAYFIALMGAWIAYASHRGI